MKTKTVEKKFTVIKDSREREGWSFIKSERCLGTQTTALKVADYSISGFEDIFLIERKLTVNEFAANISGKDFARFERELEKLNKIKHAYVVLEFTLADLVGYPWTDSSLPYMIKRRIKMNGKFLLNLYLNISLKYPNIDFIFAGSSGKELALSLFSTISKLYPERLDAVS
jgi:hypothetical protein